MAKKKIRNIKPKAIPRLVNGPPSTQGLSCGGSREISRKDETLFRLQNSGLISEQTLLTKLGFDFDEEVKRIHKELKNKVKASICASCGFANHSCRCVKPSSGSCGNCGSPYGGPSQGISVGNQTAKQTKSKDCDIDSDRYELVPNGDITIDELAQILTAAEFSIDEKTYNKLGLSAKFHFEKKDKEE